MKLSQLLRQREGLLQQLRLANLSYAYAKLTDFAGRIRRARLTGEVVLRQAAPSLERYTASLTTREGNQSVIEEHFADEDVADLADIVSYLTGEPELDVVFPIDEVADKFLRPVRQELEHIGVSIDLPQGPVTTASEDGTYGCSQVDEKS